MTVASRFFCPDSLFVSVQALLLHYRTFLFNKWVLYLACMSRNILYMKDIVEVCSQWKSFRKPSELFPVAYVMYRPGKS